SFFSLSYDVSVLFFLSCLFPRRESLFCFISSFLCLIPLFLFPSFNYNLVLRRSMIKQGCLLLISV
ncbi:hypothetical protein CSUI_009476, partial [Cystoisospora suis]